MNIFKLLHQTSETSCDFGENDPLFYEKKKHTQSLQEGQSFVPSCGAISRQSRSQRASDTGHHGLKTRGIAGLSCLPRVFTRFIPSQKRNLFWLFPKTHRIKLHGIELCHWIGHHSFGPYTCKIGVDSPTRSRFSVSRPLFALRFFFCRVLYAVLLGGILIPISFISGRGVYYASLAIKNVAQRCTIPETRQSCFRLAKPHTRS